MSKTLHRIRPATILLRAACGALIDRILEKLMNRRLLVIMGLAALLAVLLLAGCQPVMAPAGCAIAGCRRAHRRRAA
jgi:hypothetical protein